MIGVETNWALFASFFSVGVNKTEVVFTDSLTEMNTSCAALPVGPGWKLMLHGEVILLVGRNDPVLFINMAEAIQCTNIYPVVVGHAIRTTCVVLAVDVARGGKFGYVSVFISFQYYRKLC